jgi:hypothetical protein
MNHKGDFVPRRIGVSETRPKRPSRPSKNGTVGTHFFHTYTRGDNFYL